MNRPIDIGTDRRAKPSKQRAPTLPVARPAQPCRRTGRRRSRRRAMRWDEMMERRAASKQATQDGTARRDDEMRTPTTIIPGDGKQAVEATSNMRLDRETTERDDDTPRPARRRAGRGQARRRPIEWEKRRDAMKQAGRSESVRRPIQHEPVIGIASSGIEYEMTREREPPPAYHRHTRHSSQLIAHNHKISAPHDDNIGNRHTTSNTSEKKSSTVNQTEHGANLEVEMKHAIKTSSVLSV